MQVSENAPIASSSGWYDKTCVPFAREVAAQLEANGQTGPKYTLLLVSFFLFSFLSFFPVPSLIVTYLHRRIFLEP